VAAQGGQDYVLEQAGKVGTPFWLSGKEGAHHRRGSTVTASRRRGEGGADEVLGDHHTIKADVRDVAAAPGGDRRRLAMRRPRWWMTQREWTNGGCRAPGWSGEARRCGNWTRRDPKLVGGIGASMTRKREGARSAASGISSWRLASRGRHAQGSSKARSRGIGELEMLMAMECERGRFFPWRGMLQGIRASGMGDTCGQRGIVRAVGFSL
jgi:hypothetical protein